jgi:hypothetical protein
MDVHDIIDRKKTAYNKALKTMIKCAELILTKLRTWKNAHLFTFPTKINSDLTTECGFIVCISKEYGMYISLDINKCFEIHTCMVPLNGQVKTFNNVHICQSVEGVQTELMKQHKISN